MNPPRLPATENVTLTMTSLNMHTSVGYSLIPKTSYINFWWQYWASKLMKQYKSIKILKYDCYWNCRKIYTDIYIDQSPCMEECHTVCTTSEQFFKNIRFWLHKIYYTSHTPLGAQVQNHAVSLPHVSTFFFFTIFRAGTQHWKTQHLLIMSQTCSCRLKNTDVEFVKRWLKLPFLKSTTANLWHS
jgi:hypothetical protein